MSTWEIDGGWAAEAAKAFPDHHPVAERNGSHCRLHGTPNGTILILALGPEDPGAHKAHKVQEVHKALAVLAERPPAGAVGFDPSVLPPAALRHVRRERLRPWMLISGRSAAEAIPLLSSSRAAADTQAGPPEGLLAMAEPRAVIGECRRTLRDQLAGVIRAERSGSPLPTLLAAVDGVGRRTLAVAAAGMLDLEPLELPLARLLLVERVLSTPAERLFQTLMALGEALSDRHLLVVSDAETLAFQPGLYRRYVLKELDRLPCRVTLLGTMEVRRLAGVVDLACPGLDGSGPLGELLAAECPGVDVAPAALEQIRSAATVDGVGVVPARALALVEAGRTLGDPAARRLPEALTPDDATPAIEIVAKRAWPPEADMQNAWQ